MKKTKRVELTAEEQQVSRDQKAIKKARKAYDKAEARGNHRECAELAKEIALLENREKWYANIKEYVSSCINWRGKEVNLKDAVVDGPIAVFSLREDPLNTYVKHWTFDCYDMVICTDKLKDAQTIVKYNAPTRAKIVDLRYFITLGTYQRSWAPMSYMP